MIRKHYRTVFHEDKFTPLDEMSADKKMDSRKVYKIKYALNMLPSIGVYMNREINSYKKPDEEGYITTELQNEDKNILELCA